MLPEKNWYERLEAHNKNHAWKMAYIQQFWGCLKSPCHSEFFSGENCYLYRTTRRMTLLHVANTAT